MLAAVARRSLGGPSLGTIPEKPVRRGLAPLGAGEVMNQAAICCTTSLVALEHGLQCSFSQLVAVGPRPPETARCTDVRCLVYQSGFSGQVDGLNVRPPFG